VRGLCYGKEEKGQSKREDEERKILKLPFPIKVVLRNSRIRKSPALICGKANNYV
jgi:hypothetical protein